MSLDIPAVAQKLNQLASRHPFGKLQEIRTKLKLLKQQPGYKLFTARTTFENWAFHHGGRKELQFNIGYATDDSGSDLRYGVAFSFERSQTLPSIDILVPKVKLFNDFMELNADEFDDMRMWHYQSGDRSVDRPPGTIPSSLVKDGVFVFLGNRQPAKKINYKVILDDFDRLMTLYTYVESDGASAPVQLPKTGFSFQAGRAKKVATAKATLVAKELDLDLRHNCLQDALYKRLAQKYGRENVRTEQPSGVGTLIDLVVKVGGAYWFYEIKTALTPRGCFREAIGQLLEYGLWPGAQEPARFIVVGESQLDTDGQEYLTRLRKRFSLPIEYEAITT